MKSIARRITLTILSIFLLVQIPIVHQQIIKFFLPKNLTISEIRSHGLFPIFLNVTKLTIQSDGKNFIEINNASFDTRYFLLRRQIALNASEIKVFKIPSKNSKQTSVREFLDQITQISFFHDMNIDSLKLLENNKILCDYKVDWDLKRDRMTFFAKSNIVAELPDRIEIDGVPGRNEISDGHIKIIKGYMTLDGTYHLKGLTLQTDISVQSKDNEILKIQPTIHLNEVDEVGIPELNLVTPLFNWHGKGKVETAPKLSALLTDGSFFLG